MCKVYVRVCVCVCVFFCVCCVCVDVDTHKTQSRSQKKLAVHGKRPQSAFPMPLGCYTVGITRTLKPQPSRRAAVFVATLPSVTSPLVAWPDLALACGLEALLEPRLH